MIPGGKLWFSAGELAELKLPGLPGAKRKINQLAEAERWALAVDGAGANLARPRAGRGGGLEYHLSVLPPATAAALAKCGVAAPIAAIDDAAAAISCATTPAAQIWAWFDRQSDATKAEARRRLDAIVAVTGMERFAGATRTTAVGTIAGERGIGSATLWGWFSLVAGVDPADWLPHVAPRRQGGGCEAPIDDAVWQVFKSDYLRPEKPTLSTVYRRAKAFAATRGLSVPCLKTFQRKLEREVDGRAIIAKREGEEALRRSLPPQQRTVAGLSALEAVNIDGHKWDVFVRFPDGRIGRPMMVAIQDIYSRKFLAWRIGESESAEQTRLTFADLFARWGIPGLCVMDNGRAFASKQITGGAKTRYRFKVRDEDPAGVLTMLGIEIKFAMPYRGQSKPIERGFRDFCDAIARHPAFAGAYTGNTVDAKPDNYGDRAVDLETFRRIVDVEIAAHNARPGRRTEIAQGRSFDDVFLDSYGRSIIRKATPEQVRIALTAADQVTVDRNTGHVTLFGNRYWSPELGQLAGQRVMVRFDPADLTREIHVYTAKGAFLATVPILEQSGFFDVEASKRQARLVADQRKAARRAIELENLLSPEALAASLPDYIDETDAPEPAAIRPVRSRGTTAAALKLAASDEEFAAARPAIVDRFAAGVGRLRVVE